MFIILLIPGATANCNQVSLKRVGDPIRQIMTPVPQEGYYFYFGFVNDGSSAVTFDVLEAETTVDPNSFTLSVLTPVSPPEDLVVDPNSRFKFVAVHLTAISGQMQDFYTLTFKARNQCGGFVEIDTTLHVI